MNAPEKIVLPDVQSKADTRALAIDAVGVSDLRYPLAIASNGVLHFTIATLAEAGQSAPPWMGETRFIGVELLDAARAGLAAPIYYVAGPPALVEAVRATLESAGVSDDDTRSEEFYGY